MNKYTTSSVITCSKSRFTAKSALRASPCMILQSRGENSGYTQIGK